MKYRQSSSQHSCNDKQRMKKGQLPDAPPVHESGSPRTTPPDMRNQEISQPQRRIPMQPLQRKMQHVSHCRVHKKDIDSIPICKRYKLSMIYDLQFILCRE